MDKIDGLKTYIGLTVVGVVGILLSLGVIETNTFIGVESVVGVLTGWSYRHAIKKAER